MINTRRLRLLATLLATLGYCLAPVAADEAREQRQAELDAACERDRESKLAPIREGLVEKCVNEREFESRGECEAYYADYGARTGGQRGGRAPLFYDLPSCVEAFEYQQSERSGG